MDETKTPRSVTPEAQELIDRATVREARRKKIESFRDLEKNWDSYGAERFSMETIEAALVMNEHIPTCFESVLPLASGGVMFGINGDDVTIEVWAADDSTPAIRSIPDRSLLAAQSAQIEELKVDAERYRWIRNQMVKADEEAQKIVQIAWRSASATQLDIAIDAVKSR